MTYPNSTGFQKGSATSEASAKALDDTGAADSQAAYIEGFLTERSLRGATVDELTQAMQENGFPNIHNGTVAGRVVHLEHQGIVIKTAVVRKTRSNREANVYMMARHADVVQVIESFTIADLRPTLRNLLDYLESGKSVRVEAGGNLHGLLRKYFQ